MSVIVDSIFHRGFSFRISQFSYINVSVDVCFFSLCQYNSTNSDKASTSTRQWKEDNCGPRDMHKLYNQQVVFSTLLNFHTKRQSLLCKLGG